MTGPRRRSLPLLLALAALVLPGAVVGSGSTVTSAPAAAAAQVVHVVQPGDTLSALARRYRVTSAQLADWNDLGSPYSLHVDGVLRVSRPTSTAQRPSFKLAVAPVTASSLGATYRSGCPVAPSSLRLLTVRRTTPTGTWGLGEIVVHKDAAVATAEAFRTLYNRRVPVALMQPVSVYDGSDERSMAANNTSGFNCRRTTGGSSWSEHSYGRAVDVNPVQNPYVRGTTVLPPAGAGYTDRSRYRAGMLHAKGGVRAFTSQGLHWGGSWSSLKDYQHFSTTNR